MLISLIVLLLTAIMFAGFSSPATGQQTEAATITTPGNNNTTINTTGAEATIAASGTIQSNVHMVKGDGGTLPPRSDGGDEADCPSGEILAGGGYHSTSAEVNVYENFPLDENTWIVAGFNEAPVGSATITAYALCIGQQPTDEIAAPTDTIGVDTTAPVLTVPETIYGIAHVPPGSIQIRYFVEARDDRDGYASLEDSSIPTKVSLECNPPSDSNFPIGNTTVQCSASDASGNTGNASFIISVSPAPDTDAVQNAEPSLLEQEQQSSPEEQVLVEEQQAPALGEEQEEEQAQAEEPSEGDEGTTPPDNNGEG
jgi:hypothetical protein